MYSTPFSPSSRPITSGGFRKDRGMQHGRDRNHRHHRVSAVATAMNSATAAKILAGSSLGPEVFSRNSWANTLSSTSESELVLTWRKSCRNRSLLSSSALVRLPFVCQHDAERRVDVERLRLGRGRCTTRGWIAHVSDAHVTQQVAHVARPEYGPPPCQCPCACGSIWPRR